MKKIILLLLVAIIVLSNFPPIKLLIEPTIGKTYHFQTLNKEFEFDLIPSKGIKLENLKSNFGRFYMNSQGSDHKLYRTFKKEYWRFWNWGEYLFSEKYRYDYLAPSE